MQDNWWIWIAVILFFVIGQAWRALFRIAKAPPNNGLARLNAAAERILKDRGASASNPIPRIKAAETKSMQAKSMQGKSKPAPTRPARVHHTKPSQLLQSSTPAVIRRGSLLGGKEPVIQRRH